MSKEKRGYHDYTSDVQLLIDYTRGTRLIRDSDLIDACYRLEDAIKKDLTDYSVPIK